MKDITKEILIMIAVLLISHSILFYAGYKYGKVFGYSTGEQVGYDRGYESAWNSILRQSNSQNDFEKHLDEKEGGQK